MSTPADYRAKALAYAELARTAVNAELVRVFEGRRNTLTVLADNAQWMNDHHAQLVHAAPDLQAMPPRNLNQPIATEDRKDANEGGRHATQ